MPKKRLPRLTEPLDAVVEKWVAAHGEAVNYADAAEMLGISKPTVWRLVNSGALAVTPNKRVLVRSAAVWANSLGR